MPLYRLYGLTVDSEFELPGRLDGGGRPDLAVRWGGIRPIPMEPPPGTTLARLVVGETGFFTTRTSDGYVIRYPDACEALANEGLDRIELFSPTEEKRPLTEAIFVGTVMAKVMMMGGHCVLHASAIAADGKTFAFVGAPGAGKTTVAAMMCSAGAELVTDDVLRLEPTEGGWRAPAGTAQLRLREAARSLAPELGGTIQETVDNRTGVSLSLAGDFPVSALVFPMPSREAAEVELRPLSQEDVLMRLTRFPRIAGWKDHRILATNFRWTARIAREIPGYEAIVPWGPPFRPEVANALLRMLVTAVHSPG